jgi:hypothetical protein
VKRQRPPRSARAEEHEGHLVAAASEEAVTTMRVAGEEEGGFSGGRLPTGGGKNRLWVEVEMMRSMWLHRTG